MLRLADKSTTFATSMLQAIRKNVVVRSVIAMLEMSGIILDRFKPLRILLLGLIIIEILAFNYIPYLSSYEFSIWYAIIWFVVRQTFLFASFTPNGIAARMKNRWGEDKAGEIYLVITALSFWYRARSYSLLLKHTTWDLLPQYKTMFPTLFTVWGTEVNALVMVSYAMAIFGMVVNVWCFLLIERGAYYYMDMFYGRFLTDFKKQGPYKWFPNPMYGVGQIPSYGVALAAGSFSGIVMTMANQVCAYAFYYWLEKPHINRCVSQLKTKTKVEEEVSLTV